MRLSRLWTALVTPEVLYVLFVGSQVFKTDPRLGPLSGNATTGLLAAATICSLVGHGCPILSRLRRFAYVTTCMGLFALWLIFTMTFTSDIEAGMAKAIRFTLLTVPAMIVPLLLFNDMRSIKRFLTTWGVLGAIFTLDALTKKGAAESWETLSGFGAYYLETGRLCGMAALACALLLLFSQTKVSIVFGATMGLLSIIGLINSGSRGPALGLVVAVVLLGCSVIWYRQMRGQIVILVGMAIAVPLLLFGSTNSIVSDAGMNRIADLYETAFTSQTVSNRAQQWENALGVFSSHPFGVGIGSLPKATGYRITDESGFVGNYPHNLFIETAGELGLPGLILLCLMFAYLLRGLVSNLATRDFELQWTSMCGVTLTAYWLINAMTSNDLNGNRPLFAIIGASAVWISGEVCRDSKVVVTSGRLRPFFRPGTVVTDHG